MLRMICSENVHQAKSYYTSSLRYEADPCRLGQYYGQEQEIVGQWQGLGSVRLGLVGRVDQKSFERLCENQHPGSGGKLTPRRNEERRVGYDFNFHCPKSVSIVHALTGDDGIVTVFRESVAETMRQIESDMKTRVRKQGADEDRHTGNMVWGEFIHFTARPVNGRPDPHLHAHCYAFNATFDAVENRWKAGQFGDINRDIQYYQAAFHARLTQKVVALGYAVVRAGDWWEIEGVSREIIGRFSKRTELIEEVAQKEGITNPHIKNELGARTREKKVLTPMAELKQDWAERVTPGERESLSSLMNFRAGPAITSRQAMDYALSHCYERASVVTDKELMTEALWHGIGQVGVYQVESQLGRGDILIQEIEGRKWCTTREVLREEIENITFVQASQGTCPAFQYLTHAFQNEKLGEDQKAAVRHVLASTDRITAIRGPAGTGKTTMMKEAVSALQTANYQVFTFAPSAEASRNVLRREGFENAQTVAHLLTNTSLHPQLRHQVLWIDEAGLLSARQMRALFRLAEEQDCRVLLSGDTAQHTSVERGDALRLLEKYAGLKPAELTEIRRQRQETYRAAVQELSQGHAVAGFQKLEQMEAIIESPETERYRRLAQDYVKTVSKRKTALVVSPTHAEGAKVTAEIRAELKQRGQLSNDERKFARLVNLRWTEAQRGHRQNYRAGLVVQFYKNTPGFVCGQRLTLVEAGPDRALALEDERGLHPFPLEHGSRFHVYETEALSIAPGDQIRVTQNGTTADGKHKLNNGAVHQVKGFTPKGDLKLTNGWIVSQDYGHLAHGYCQTSHAAQSKTVDHVFIAQSTTSLGAASAEQFYVSVSRARDGITVYTDNKALLARSIEDSGARLSAHDLLGNVPDLPAGPLEKLLQEQGLRPQAKSDDPRKDPAADHGPVDGKSEHARQAVHAFTWIPPVETAASHFSQHL